MVYDISSRGHSGLPEVGKALSRSQELSPAVQIAGQLSRIRLMFSSLDPEIAAISPPPGENQTWAISRYCTAVRTSISQSGSRVGPARSSATSPAVASWRAGFQDSSFGYERLTPASPLSPHAGRADHCGWLVSSCSFTGSTPLLSPIEQIIPHQIRTEASSEGTLGAAATMANEAQLLDKRTCMMPVGQTISESQWTMRLNS